MLFTVLFEKVLVTFVRNEEKCCVILVNFINCRAISNEVSLRINVILTLEDDEIRKFPEQN